MIGEFPIEIGDDERALLNLVREREFSMVSDAGLFATAMAVRYASTSAIAGDFVECGVWRGFDTFAGMTPPAEIDRTVEGSPARQTFVENERPDHNEWCYCPLDQVKANFSVAGLLDDRIMFVQGDVAQTLRDSKNLPEKISVLRLDTDWYESTKLELEILYPRLSAGGVLILDDYGYWQGSREATDEYFARVGGRPFFAYIDHGARLAIKPF